MSIQETKEIAITFNCDSEKCSKEEMFTGGKDFEYAHWLILRVTKPMNGIVIDRIKNPTAQPGRYGNVRAGSLSKTYCFCSPTCAVSTLTPDIEATFTEQKKEEEHSNINSPFQKSTIKHIRF